MPYRFQPALKSYAVKKTRKWTAEINQNAGNVIRYTYYSLTAGQIVIQVFSEFIDKSQRKKSKR